MKTVWVHDGFYEVDDDVDLFNLALQKRRENKEKGDLRKLKKENERLKYELEEKEHLLALREKRGLSINNKSNDITRREKRDIENEATRLSSEYALKEFKKIKLNKGIKIDWKIK